MSIQAGTRLGPYKILSLIGAGGMGQVYKANDTRLDRIVAIKVLSPHLAADPERRERFEREAQIISKLEHPHICRLYDIGRQEGVEVAIEFSQSRDSDGAAHQMEGQEPQAAGRKSTGMSNVEGRMSQIDYLVMEYLDGETLTKRLTRGPLSLDQVLRYTVEMADALDTAHRHSVTHRDLKPGNVMLTRQGSKLMDFGLAKLRHPVVHRRAPHPSVPSSVNAQGDEGMEGGGEEGRRAPRPDDASLPEGFSSMPTPLDTLTEKGAILGTLQYMAPEQLEGKEADARTDIFAFGAVVYEMVTGKKAFEAKSQASLIGAIMERDPQPMTTLQPLTPSALDRVVRKCLRKDPDERWQSARDLTDEQKWIAEGGSQVAPAALPATAGGKGLRRTWWRTAILSLGMLLLGAAIAGLAVWNLKPSPSLAHPVTRAVITLPPGDRLAGLENTPAVALSPDGSHLVYAAGRGGTGQLYLRSMDSLEARAISGTEGAANPFFSPDGQWVGFFAGGKLKKVSVSGGAAVTLGNATNPRGASWGRQGVIAFAPIATSALQQVPDAGGAPQPLTRLEKGENSHRWPEFLPGGKGVLFATSPVSSNWTNAQVAVQPVGTGEQRNLIAGTQPRYAPSGHLVYAQAGTLMAVTFDPERLEVTGAPVPVVEGVLQSTVSGDAQYSLSATGSLVYVPGGVQATQRRLVWVNRSGAEQPLAAPAHAYQRPRLSPDGQRFLMLKPTEQASAPTQINVVLNWFEELKRKVPVGKK